MYKIKKIMLKFRREGREEISVLYREVVTNDIEAFRQSIIDEFGCAKVGLGYVTIPNYKEIPEEVNQGDDDPQEKYGK